jgi:hypothetical protein
VSFGLGRLSGGSAATLRGTNLFGGLAPEVAPCFPALGGMADRHAARGAAGRCAAGKSYSMLALGDALYLWLTPGSNGQAYEEARLLAAPLPLTAGGWRRAGWAFTRNEAPSLLSPMFVQAGAGGADLPFVYAYAAGYAPVGAFALQRGARGGRLYLLRAPKVGPSLTDRGAWEFYAGKTSQGAVWTGQQALAEPVFEDPRGVGWPTSATYAAALGRFILVTEHDRTATGSLGVFEAEAPEGPWRTVFYGTLANPAAGVPATSFYADFLPGSVTAEGRFTLLFTGAGPLDARNAVDGRFTLAPTAVGERGAGKARARLRR